MVAPLTSHRADCLSAEELPRITHDVAMLQTLIVNLYFVGEPGLRNPSWVLVDAGMPFSESRILHAAEKQFGPGARPQAIILTHGHFDHVGGLPGLAERWDVPVYAHDLELPYLTGRSKYPPPDPTVGGGMMTRSSFLYPRGPIDLGARARVLPADGSVPFMPGWQWIHTPGHSPGHVSLFRESDRMLIAGDAFVTTKQESLVAALMQPRLVHRPPAYFTPDWTAARQSVRRLESLRPAIAATGHGLPMSNPRLAHELHLLARDFDQVARPRHGRYVNHPATMDRNGVVSVPPPAPDPLPKLVAGLAIVATLAALHRATRHDHI